jgi:hypothetical protein
VDNLFIQSTPPRTGMDSERSKSKYSRCNDNELRLYCYYISYSFRKFAASARSSSSL